MATVEACAFVPRRCPPLVTDLPGPEGCVDPCARKLARAMKAKAVWSQIRGIFQTSDFCGNVKQARCALALAVVRLMAKADPCAKLPHLSVLAADMIGLTLHHVLDDVWAARHAYHGGGNKVPAALLALGLHDPAKVSQLITPQEFAAAMILSTVDNLTVDERTFFGHLRTNRYVPVGGGRSVYGSGAYHLPLYATFSRKLQSKFGVDRHHVFPYYLLASSSYVFSPLALEVLRAYEPALATPALVDFLQRMGSIIVWSQPKGCEPDKWRQTYRDEWRLLFSQLRVDLPNKTCKVPCLPCGIQTLPRPGPVPPPAPPRGPIATPDAAATAAPTTTTAGPAPDDASSSSSESDTPAGSTETSSSDSKAATTSAVAKTTAPTEESSTSESETEEPTPSATAGAGATAAKPGEEESSSEESEAEEKPAVPAPPTTTAAAKNQLIGPKRDADKISAEEEERYASTETDVRAVDEALAGMSQEAVRREARRALLAARREARWRQAALSAKGRELVDAYWGAVEDFAIAHAEAYYDKLLHGVHRRLPVVLALPDGKQFIVTTYKSEEDFSDAVIEYLQKILPPNAAAYLGVEAWVGRQRQLRLAYQSMTKTGGAKPASEEEEEEEAEAPAVSSTTDAPASKKKRADPKPAEQLTEKEREQRAKRARQQAERRARLAAEKEALKPPSTTSSEAAYDDESSSSSSEEDVPETQPVATGRMVSSIHKKSHSPSHARKVSAEQLFRHAFEGHSSELEQALILLNRANDEERKELKKIIVHRDGSLTGKALLRYVVDRTPSSLRDLTRDQRQKLTKASVPPPTRPATEPVAAAEPEEESSSSSSEESSGDEQKLIGARRMRRRFRPHRRFHRQGGFVRHPWGRQFIGRYGLRRHNLADDVLFRLMLLNLYAQPAMMQPMLQPYLADATPDVLLQLQQPGAPAEYLSLQRDPAQWHAWLSYLDPLDGSRGVQLQQVDHFNELINPTLPPHLRAMAPSVRVKRYLTVYAGPTEYQRLWQHAWGPVPPETDAMIQTYLRQYPRIPPRTLQVITELVPGVGTY